MGACSKLTTKIMGSKIYQGTKEKYFLLLTIYVKLGRGKVD